MNLGDERRELAVGRAQQEMIRLGRARVALLDAVTRGGRNVEFHRRAVAVHERGVYFHQQAASFQLEHSAHLRAADPFAPRT